MASSEQQQHVITEDELNDLLGIVEPEPGDEVVSDLTVLQQENQLYELIEERVSESQIEIPCLKKVIGKLLEDQGVTVGALLNLAQNSLTTPDDVLSQALSSQVSANPPKETKSNKESTVYYIRSITFSVEVMITATNRYKDAYLDDAYCDDLLQELEKVPKGTDVYLRYVGCTSATTPVERHQEDVSSNISTRFGNFHQIMAAFGEVPTTIHELPLLTVEGELGKATDEQRHMIDGTEQTLIHLLGRHVLMNSQPGGYFRDYVPDPQSESVVKNLQLGVVKAHFSDVAMVNDNDEELGDIKYHYTTLHKNLKNMNTPVTTQMAKMLMEPGYIDFLADQAFSGPPANGTMPLMILGKDITYSSFRNKEKFFEGSRAGDITKLLANQVLGASNAFVSSCIHDLWCIPSKRHKDHLPHFIECTSSILRTLDTQLIVTLGYDPAVVAFSKFRDWYVNGLQMNLHRVTDTFMHYF